MNTMIMKMTDAYQHQSFYNNELYKKETITITDFRDIQGTRCYLDDLAKEEIKKRIYEFPAKGIHFIDSGNYHYLSLLWLEKLDEDFNLILFDHHPDNQPPSFGAITSCGGWVLEATESLPHLKNVYTYGVGEEIPLSEIPNDLPLYISIDKDVLSTEFAVTDWDQGNMTIDELLEDLKILFKNHKILGVDICGDSGETLESVAKINNQTNSLLFDFLSENF